MTHLGEICNLNQPVIMYLKNLRHPSQIGEDFAKSRLIMKQFLSVVDTLHQNNLRSVNEKTDYFVYWERKLKQVSAKDAQKLILQERIRIVSLKHKAEISRDKGETKRLDEFLKILEKFIIDLKLREDLESYNQELEQSTPIDTPLIKEREHISLPPDFCQITCDANQAQIEAYFLPLAEIKNPVNNQSIMIKSDVVDMINTHFSAFKKKPGELRYYNLNLQPNQHKEFYQFIYDFYYQHEAMAHGNKLKYCRFLTIAFKQFSKQKPENLKKNMVQSKFPATNFLLGYKK